MRDEMFFIDGELVDLDDDTKITLNIKSNLFTDLSKIVSNNSYTIKLPKTVRNQRIIEHADLPACGTDYPRKFHQGRYFRNGVEIVPDAKVALISCSETLDVALTWGNINLLDSIINGDKTLNDLSEDTSSGFFIIWERELSTYKSDQSFIISDIDFGIRNYDTKNFIHPCVRVNWILNRITKDSGIHFSFPTSIQEQFIDTLLIPLLTKKGERENIYNRLVCEMEYRNGQVSGKGDYYVHAAIRGQAGNDYMQVVDKSGDIYWGVQMQYDNVKLRITGKMSLYYSSDMARNPRFVAYTIKDGKTTEVFSADCASLEQTSGDNWYVTFDFDEDSSILETGDILYFAFDDMGYVVSNITPGYGIWNIVLNYSIDEASPEETGISNGIFPIIPNLPSIKWIDLIKSIALMCGLFAIPEGKDTIRFVSADEIVKNKINAVDWTKKVVATYPDNKPNSITYSISNFAQNNHYRYKEDSYVRGNYDSSLHVDNKTAEKDVDIVTLPFAGTDNKNRKAYIPIYEYSNSENGVGELITVEPRILKEMNIGGFSAATFDGLSWKVLLSEYYASYQKLIEHTVVIKEKIEISDFELKIIDVTVPVYLAQYGRYYAILSIKAENTGICECELLQLEV